MAADEHLSPGQFARRQVPIDQLVAESHSMSEVLKSGRKSLTPDEPVMLKRREDTAGLEIADGHHRVADAIKNGRTHVLADIDSQPDDEPYEPPFYNFRQHTGGA